MVKYKDWENFCDYLINHNRYILDNKRNKISNEIVKQARKRETVIEKNVEFWRARFSKNLIVKNKEIIPDPYINEEMGAPPQGFSKGGRANPLGISYLYLADHIETAIAEIKPYIGARIDLASFKLKKKIKVIDIRKNSPSLLEVFQTTPKSKQRNIDFLWFGIKIMFSVPIAPEDNLGYIPTQYIAELFKSKGYDGLMFESVQRKNSMNLVLFDPNHADVFRREDRTIHDIKYIDNISYMKELTRPRS